jgi:holliday junction DNA helicase RuvA
VIGWLRGDVLAIGLDGTVTVNVGDVGYQVMVPTRALGDLVEGAPAEFFVHTRVREDAIQLFGFATSAERSIFELLLVTPGVGPATALGALSTMSGDQLRDAIARADVTALATIPGIGKKTAGRLVLELSGKLPEDRPDAPAATKASADVVAGLRQLGYGAAEIREALKDVTLPDDESAALRVALRQLGRV